jgi:hypothetical protein
MAVMRRPRWRSLLFLVPAILPAHLPWGQGPTWRANGKADGVILGAIDQQEWSRIGLKTSFD